MKSHIGWESRIRREAVLVNSNALILAVLVRIVLGTVAVIAICWMAEQVELRNRNPELPEGVVKRTMKHDPPLHLQRLHRKGVKSVEIW